MRVSVSDLSAQMPPVTVSPPVSQSPASGEASLSFAHVLSRLSHEISGGEKMMRTAIESMQTGSDLGASQLIALQAGVYRYSEVIDLASRLVDRATGGIKTIVQGGGQ